MPERRGKSLSVLDKDNGQAGMYACSSVTSLSTAVPTASRAVLSRFVPSRNMTITKIAFCVTTASGTDDAVDVGIYNSALTRLVSSGATTGLANSTGLKTATVAATTLLAGTVYYAAFSSPTTAAIFVSLNWLSNPGASFFGSSAPQAEMLFMNAAHPLPSSVTAGGTISGGPLLAVRES